MRSVFSSVIDPKPHLWGLINQTNKYIKDRMTPDKEFILSFSVKLINLEPFSQNLFPNLIGYADPTKLTGLVEKTLKMMCFFLQENINFFH